MKKTARSISIVWRAAFAGALAIATLSAHAQSVDATRCTAVDPKEVAQVTKLPPDLNTSPVTVVVLLAGDPVAIAQEAAGSGTAKGGPNPGFSVREFRGLQLRNIPP